MYRASVGIVLLAATWVSPSRDYFYQIARKRCTSELESLIGKANSLQLGRIRGVSDGETDEYVVFPDSRDESSGPTEDELVTVKVV
jgi:hypothetical protein